MREKCTKKKEKRGLVAGGGGVTGLVAGMDIFDGIGEEGEVLTESGLGEDDCTAAVVGMETKRRSGLQAGIQEKDHMVVRVVDESERTDAARFESQISHHPFGRSEREFAGCFFALRDQDVFEPMLYIMDRQVVIAGKTDQIVLVALVIPHEDIFAMDAAVVMPPSFGFFNRFAFRMVIGGERNMVLFEKTEYFFLTV